MCSKVKHVGSMFDEDRHMRGNGGLKAPLSQ